MGAGVALVTTVDLLDVSHWESTEELDADEDEDPADEQENVLDDPIDERNDGITKRISTSKWSSVLLVELMVEVVDIDGRLIDDVERNQHCPGDQVGPGTFFIGAFVSVDEKERKDDDEQVHGGEGNVKLVRRSLLALHCQINIFTASCEDSN